MVDVYKLIDKIRPRPALYLGENSISLLRAFLGGYMTAVYESETSIEQESPPFPDFHNWVAMKLGYFESTSGWANMLLASEGGDEAKALEQFFGFLDEFRKREAKVIFWAVPDASKVWRIRIEGEQGDKRTNISPPALVQIVKYTEDRGVFIRYLDDNGKLLDREEFCQELDDAFRWTDSIVGRSDWKQTEA